MPGRRELLPLGLLEISSLPGPGAGDLTGAGLTSNRGMEAQGACLLFVKVSRT